MNVPPLYAAIGCKVYWNVKSVLATCRQQRSIIARDLDRTIVVITRESARLHASA